MKFLATPLSSKTAAIAESASLADMQSVYAIHTATEKHFDI